MCEIEKSKIVKLIDVRSGDKIVHRKVSEVKLIDARAGGCYPGDKTVCAQETMIYARSRARHLKMVK